MLRLAVLLLFSIIIALGTFVPSTEALAADGVSEWIGCRDMFFYPSKL